MKTRASFKGTPLIQDGVRQRVALETKTIFPQVVRVAIKKRGLDI